MTPFWRTWLRVWCWATFGFGAVLAAAAFPALDGPTRWFYDLVHWPLDGQSSFDENVRFTCGVLGAVMIGWALTIFATVDAAEKLGAPVWRALTTAMVVWYVIDSAISVATGAPVNAVSNTVFLITYLAPILASGVLGGATTRAA
jgi:hypothetical protein